MEKHKLKKNFNRYLRNKHEQEVKMMAEKHEIEMKSFVLYYKFRARTKILYVNDTWISHFLLL